MMDPVSSLDTPLMLPQSSGRKSARSARQAGLSPVALPQHLLRQRRPVAACSALGMTAGAGPSRPRASSRAQYAAASLLSCPSGRRQCSHKPQHLVRDCSCHASICQIRSDVSDSCCLQQTRQHARCKLPSPLLSGPLLKLHWVSRLQESTPRSGCRRCSRRPKAASPCT